MSLFLSRIWSAVCVPFTLCDELNGELIDYAVSLLLSLYEFRLGGNVV